MREQTMNMTDEDGVDIFVYHWSPEEEVEIKGIVQIAHGMAETAARYERFARYLTDAGYVVLVNDHRGHGKTAGQVENLGYLGEDGFNWMVRAMAQVSHLIHEEYPGQPIYLFAHSMGSFLGQQFIYEYPKLIDGVILSGSNGKRGPELLAGIILSSLIAKVKGDKFRSKLVDELAFGSFNRHIVTPRTPFDWLSRDSKEVDKYVKDPYCGSLSTVSFYRDFFIMLRDIHKPENMSHIPRELPVFIISGDEDPVGDRGQGIKRLVRMYNDLGMTQVSYKLYTGGRHELLNETNRLEVMNDCLEWLNKQVKKRDENLSS
ncbi:alpha/beta hydrolase [Brevibacillus daliensis]|uniref:alpha/beta hydrolase n=1 Tax=Brevibacillus daliensis TaxID=2892995 RepID=UPI001E54BBC1|nr:alpha/beta hydrolase [Brevibacillus daliensis]